MIGTHRLFPFDTFHGVISRHTVYHRDVWDPLTNVVHSFVTIHPGNLVSPHLSSRSDISVRQGIPTLYAV